MYTKPISASHIEKWRMCRRREAFVYRAKRKEPFAVAANAGTLVHGLLEKEEIDSTEKWGKYAIGEAAQRLSEAMPANVIVREQEITKEIDGVMFTARIDAQTESMIIDHKTTSKQKYVKSTTQLETDPQRLLYQAITGRQDSLWNYLAWDTMQVTPVVVQGSPADKERFRLHVLQPAREILAAESDNPLDYEANVSSCGLFPPAGCPFQQDCFDKNGELRHSENREEIKMSVLDFYKENEDKSPLLTQSRQTRPIGTLYVDCYPIQGVGSVTHAATLIAEAAKEVAADAHVPHALLIEFGKGPAAIAAQLAHDVDTAFKAGKAYTDVYLETRSGEGKAALFELSQRAERVVKAML